MLSPVRSTNVKPTRSRQAAIWRPTSNCARSAVPVSPMTAKRTEPCFRGSLTSDAGRVVALLVPGGIALREHDLPLVAAARQLVAADPPEGGGDLGREHVPLFR